MRSLHTPGGFAVKAAYALTYFLSFIGSPLIGDHRYLIPAAAALGLTLFILYLWVAYRFVKVFSNSSPRPPYALLALVRSFLRSYGSSCYLRASQHGDRVLGRFKVQDFSRHIWSFH